MKNLTVLLALGAGLVGLPAAVQAQTSTFTQALSLNGTGLNAGGYARAVAVDAAGNQYVGGSFNGTMQLGSTVLATSANSTDLLLAKRSGSTGAWLWAVRAGATQSMTVSGVAVDASGDVYVTGSFGGTPAFVTSAPGVSPVTTTSLTANGYTDSYVAKFAGGTGACLWAVRAGGNQDDQGNALTVDASGNLFVTGAFSATADFTTSAPGISPVTSISLTAAGPVGYRDAFVARYAAGTGACTWVVKAGGTNGDQGYGIAVSGAAVLVTGYFTETAAFITSAPGVSPVTTTSLVAPGPAGYGEIFVARFASGTGACQWAVRAGGTDDEQGLAIAADASGNAYVTGRIGGISTFVTSAPGISPVTTTSLTPVGGNDIFLARFAVSTGACAWAVSAGGAGADTGKGLSVDASSNVYLTGSFSALAAFTTSAPGISPAITTTLTPAGSYDVFVARFAGSTGAATWAVRAGGTSVEEGYGLGLDGSGNPYVAGVFNGVATFASANDATTKNQGLYVAKLNPTTGAWQAPATALMGGSSTGKAVGVDAAGNQYVAGTFAGTLVLGSTTLTAPGGQGAYLARRNAGTGTWAWAVAVASTGFMSVDGLAVDGNGNVCLTGVFSSTATFTTSVPGGTPIATTTLTTPGDNDGYVARFATSTGACTWAVRLGSPASETIGGVAVDAAGNVCVTGTIAGPATFTTSAPGISPVTTTTLTPVGGYDIFVARFTGSTGACAWAVAAGGSSTDQGQGIAVDASGNAYVTGTFFASPTFTTSAPGVSPVTTTSLATTTGLGTFVARFVGSTGACTWAVKAESTNYIAANALAVDASGNAYVTGIFYDNATFTTSAPGSSSTTTTTVLGSGNLDVFLARYATATGACTWAVAGTSTNNTYSSAVAVDASGNAYLTGYFNVATTFITSAPGVSPVTTSTLTTTGSNDVLLARFAGATGACTGLLKAGGISDDQATGLTVGANGIPYVTGLFTSAASFSALSLAGGGENAFLAALSLPPPTLSALSVSAELPGMPVVLTGAGFTGSSTVSFAGTAASSVVFTSSTSLTATVPPGAVSGLLTVGDVGGSSAGLAFAPLAVYTGGAVGSCTAAVPATATLPDGAWHYLLSGGAVVLAYKYSGAPLGTFAVDVLKANPASPVRQDAHNKYYLDCNWHLTASGGPFAGRSVALRFYGLPAEATRLQTADPSNAGSLSAFRLTQYSGVNEDCSLSNNNHLTGETRLLTPTSLTATPATVGWFGLETTVTDHFSEFYVNGGNSPLPVSLTVFEATASGPAAVRLHWATASEKDNAGFTVERSLTGEAFEAIATVAGAGHSAAPRHYALLDAHLPAAPVLYYRLRQTDTNGAVTFSPVRTVTGASQPTDKPSALQTYPNPAQGAVQVAVPTSSSASFVLIDRLGRIVRTWPAAAAGGAAVLPLAGIAPGLYTLRCGAAATRLAVE